MLSNPLDLKNVRVLVTRPDPAGALLCEQIQKLHGSAIHFPTIAFRDLTSSSEFESLLNEIEHCDWLIFISPQAVYSASTLLKKRWPVLPSQLKIAAIGTGTANAAQEVGLNVTHVPTAQFNAAGLLTLPEFNNVTGKTIAIVRGVGGREELDSVLHDKGAHVVTLIAYERILPPALRGDITNILNDTAINAILCTSADGLNNLLRLLFPSGIAKTHRYFFDITLIVMSERIKKLAVDLGFRRIWVIPATHINTNYNETILDALLNKKDQLMNDEMTTNDTLPTPPPVTPRANKWKRWGIFFTLLGFIIIVSALLIGFFALADHLSRYDSKISTLQSHLQNSQQTVVDLKNSVDKIQQLQQKSQDFFAQQEQIMAEWRSAQQGDLDKWRIAEAQYLVKLANDYLQFSNNITMAIKLLQGADQTLQKVAHANVFDLRKSLANDLMRLHSAPDIDVTAIYLQLNAMNKQIDELPLPATPLKQSPTVDENKSYAHLPWWKVIFHRGWDAIKDVVVIHYNGTNELPFVLPQERAYLLQNMHGMLENAMWGLLHREPNVYKQSLQTIQTWIQKHFIQEATITKTFLAKLSELENAPVQPIEADISTTLQEFNSYFTKIMNQDVTKTSS